jgi:hypothetical protein
LRLKRRIAELGMKTRVRGLKIPILEFVGEPAARKI